MRPAGWFSAYWFFVRPLSSIRYTAHVSPNKSCSAVYVTGGAGRESAAFEGCATSFVASVRRRATSPSPGTRTCKSALFASALFGALVHATTSAPLALAYGSNVTSSCVSPDPESITSTSPPRTTPMSPCSASTALRKMERVPVLASVWHTFLATNEVLPTPVNRVVPLQSMIFWHNAATSSKDSWCERGCAMSDGIRRR